MAAPYRSDRKCRIGREVEMMIVYILFLLLVNQADSNTRSESEVKQCNASTVININNHGQTEIILNLTEVKGEALVYINTPVGELLFYGPKDKMIIPSNPSNSTLEMLNHFSILFNDKSTLKLDVRDIHKHLAGSYCFLDGTEVIPECSLLLQVADKPQVNLTVPTTSPILQVTSNNILQGEITLTCSARSTSKPDDHNLTMVYGWFIDGVFTRSTSPTLHIELTEGQREVTCVATDYPDCGELLNNTSRTTDIKKVRENVRCENVLGESSPLKIIPEYGPYQINLRPSRSEIKKKLSEKLQVKCDVKCNPPCKVRWLRDEGDVDDDEDDDESILYIDKVEEDDGGEYTCTATNIHGVLSSSFTLWLTEVNRKDDDNISEEEDDQTPTGAATPGDSIDMQLILSVGIGILIIIIILIITAFILYRLNKGLKRGKRKRKQRVRYYEDSTETSTFIELQHDQPVKSVRVTYQPNVRGEETGREDLKVVYADLDLKPPKEYVIHGNHQNRVSYTQIDFTRLPPPRPCGAPHSDSQTDSD